MELLFALVADFWWVAPASIGAGGVGYAVITKNSRRARRLELDAARHEVQLAYRASLTARADVRTAQAQVQTAQAMRGRAAPGVPAVADAKRHLQAAKQRAKDAALLLRAARTRVKAVQASLHATARGDQLPLERLMHEHDDITARWLAYETDALKAIAYPQMSDAQHPATLAFLRAHSEAHRLRPASVKAAVRPEDFVAYRRAVTAAGEALATAEADARRSASAPPLGRTSPRQVSSGDSSRPIWPVPSRLSRPAESSEG